MRQGNKLQGTEWVWDSKGPTRTDQLEIRQHSVDIVDSLRGAIRVAGIHKSRVMEVILWSARDVNIWLRNTDRTLTDHGAAGVV